MLKFSLLNDIMNITLGIMEKPQGFALKNIVIIQFYYMYIYSKTKIERVLLSLRKRVLSLLYVYKTETTHASS